jgi:hypothetical protein
MKWGRIPAIAGKGLDYGHGVSQNWKRRYRDADPAGR